MFCRRSVDGAGNKASKISQRERSIGAASGASVSGRLRGGVEECRGVVYSSENGAILSTARTELRPECAYYSTGAVTGERGVRFLCTLTIVTIIFDGLRVAAVEKLKGSIHPSFNTCTLTFGVSRRHVGGDGGPIRSSGHPWLRDGTSEEGEAATFKVQPRL